MKKDFDRRTRPKSSALFTVLGVLIRSAQPEFACALLAPEQRKGLVLQYVTVRDVDVASPLEAVSLLDAMLRSLAA